MAELGTDLGSYLRRKRQLLRPEMIGLPDAQRLAADLVQRADIASAVGVSLAYYNRLERGHAHGLSQRVFRALVDVLELTEADAADLGRIVDSARRASRIGVHPRLLALLESWPTTAAFVCDTGFNVLASNPVAQALSPMFDLGVNVLRSMYLDPDAYSMIRNSEEVEIVTAVWAKTLAEANPQDIALTRTVGELSLQRPQFRTALARTDAPSGDGDLLLDHPAVGELDLHYQRFQIDSCPHQFLVTLHADPETPSECNLRLLTDFTDW
jgi:transcriptional regulator with XRE-family HTH domain